ncbi:MAG: hypothetical protein AAGB48_03215 [Planctomycetota bacterium]
MPVRIGDLLVQAGVLTELMRDEILEEQRILGRPFGQLAERMFGIDPDVIEQAWAEQYESLAGVVDLSTFTIDSQAVEAVTSRQAWQFKLLPIAFRHGELMICTPRVNLPRALRFAATQLAEACFFVVADVDQLADQLQRHHPMPGLGPETLIQPAPKLRPRAA